MRHILTSTKISLERKQVLCGLIGYITHIYKW